jgi:predicted PurR-regulated permease PerM
VVVRPQRTPRLQQALLIPLVILAWLALILVVGWLLSHVTRALLILVLGTLIAFALTPLVNLFARWLPRWLAIGLAYLIGFLAVFGLLGVVIATVAMEISNLVTHLPDYLRQVQDQQPAVLAILRPFNVTKSQLNLFEAQAVSELQRQGTALANDALGVVQQVLGAIVDAVLVLIISIYLTASGPQLVR